MLGKLDNQVIFKKAFTDKVVFKAFVRDVLGIDIEFDKIETEKQFEPKVGYVDFKLDIFAESIDKRVVVEIQKVEYDTNFDRFLHYFLMAIAEQQKRASNYKIDQTVYMIVVMTAPFKFDTKVGEAVRDEVLLLNLNPRTLKGHERDLYGHQLICLNPNHPSDDTPPQIRDWLQLIQESIHNPDHPRLNADNAAVQRAAELIRFENLTPEERAAAKEEFGRKNVLALERLDAAREIGRKLKEEGVFAEVIARATGLGTEEIERL
jgi:PD-(D/E)XK nuclease family transposase